MKPTETVMLTEYVQACCPQQVIGEYTADAWHDLLGDLSLADCRLAVAEVAKRQPFVAPCEIRAEVKRVREARITAAKIPAPPPELTNDPDAYSAALHAARVAAADGRDPQTAIRVAASSTRREIEAPRD
jgi:hypothetical protein